MALSATFFIVPFRRIPYTKQLSRFTALLLLTAFTVLTWLAGSVYYSECVVSSRSRSVTRAGLSQPGYATHFSASTDLSDTSGTGVEDRVLNVSPQQVGYSTGCGTTDFDSAVEINDTLYKHHFRTNIPLQDSDLIQESSFFKAGQTVKNPLITRYFIEPKNLCDGPSGPPYLLVLVPSLSSHVSMRRVIRDTWGSVVRKPWPRTSNLPKMQIVFFFGKSTYDRERFVLEKENVTHGDVVYADFHDSYRNLTFKTLTSLYWASTRCPGAKFVMKVDEDTFVNVPYLMEYLHYHQDSLAHSVVGYAHRKPVSVRTGRWAVRFKDYPLHVFPRYLYGHSYVIARDAVRSLVDVSRYVPFIPVEDALVTGVLAYMVNVTRLHNPLFAVAYRGYTCAVVKNTKVTITMITETSHRQIWEAVQANNCTNTLLGIKRKQGQASFGQNLSDNALKRQQTR